MNSKLIAKMRMFAAALAFLVAAGAAFSPALGEVVLTPVEKTLDTPIKGFNFQDMDVSQILSMIADDYKLNIIVSKQVSGPVRLRLFNVTLRKALDEILSMADATMVIQDNILHVYGRSEAPAGIAAIDSELRRNKPVTEIISPVFANSSDLSSALTPFLSDLGKIQLFKESRSGSMKPEVLIITDKPDNIDMIKGLVKLLDTETRQVLIQSKIVETTISNTELLGVDWTVGAELVGAPFNLDMGNFGNVKLGTINTKQFHAIMERLSTAGNANVLSDMSIAALDGEIATIHVGDQIPFGISTFGSSGGGVAVGTTGVEQIDVGVKLKVTPHILSGDIIRLAVEPKISQVESFTSLGPNSGSAPVIKQRTADTTIMLKTGETLVIGGLVQDSLSEDTKKVPILGDLPLVGPAFRRKTTNKAKADLVIFITATIMEKRGGPDAVVNSEAVVIPARTTAGQQ